MDDLLTEFLTETGESLDVIDNELVRFEREPNNAQILDNVFRLVHTIKGTCGFLGLPRLELLAHAAETLMGHYRDGAAVTDVGVSTILKAIDQIKHILGDLEATQKEPAGEDQELIGRMLELAGIGETTATASVGSNEETSVAHGLDVEIFDTTDDTPAAPAMDQGGTLGRALKPGEVSLAELEAAFQAAEGPAPPPPPPKAAATGPEPTEGAPGSARSENAIANQTIRVSVQTIENLMTMVSELVLTRNQLLEISRRHEDSEFNSPLQRLSNVTAELQDGVMKTRMQPIGSAWGKLPRIIRDLSHDLGKPIDLEMIGAETELDRQVLELIRDPLTHMVRNSADHGIEAPETRRAAGKPETGKVIISAYHEGGHIIISIADDGKGLNTEKLREKAIALNLATEAELATMPESQIHKFIFHPGFSTAEEVTSVSGRGVGMDVVRANIEVIGGSIDLKSVENKGTTVTIKIPLTLAIVPALIIKTAGERFAIPQLAVTELVRAHPAGPNRIERIKQAEVLRLRNALMPIVRLTGLLKMQPLDEQVATGDGLSTFVVVTQVGTQSFGIVVDEVFHTEEIVVKPMSGMLKDVAMFSGNTIMGDGSVIMIIDPNGVAQAIGQTQADTVPSEAHTGPALADEEDRISLLLFEAGSGDPKAVPLSLVTRLEEFDTSAIETSGARQMVQYREKLMPLVYVNEQSDDDRTGRIPMLVFSDGERAMGLVVDRIIDIVEEPLNVEVQPKNAGFLGSAIIRGKATEVLDVGYYLPLAYSDWFERKEQARNRQKRLLYAEDSQFFRNMTVPVLVAAGYRVTAVEDGSVAYEMVKGGAKFDLLLTDIEMPNMDGFTLASMLREDINFGARPIVALSAFTGPTSEARARELGILEFVAKFDRQGLLAALKRSEAELNVEIAA